MEPLEPEAVGSLPRRAVLGRPLKEGLDQKKAALISNSHSSGPTRTSVNNIAISVLHQH